MPPSSQSTDGKACTSSSQCIKQQVCWRKFLMNGIVTMLVPREECPEDAQCSCGSLPSSGADEQQMCTKSSQCGGSQLCWSQSPDGGSPTVLGPEAVCMENAKCFCGMQPSASTDEQVCAKASECAEPQTCWRQFLSNGTRTMLGSEEACPENAQCVCANATQPPTTSDVCAPLTPRSGVNGSACAAVPTGEKCIAECAEGYGGSSGSSFVCNETGVLFGEYPICERKRLCLEGFPREGGADAAECLGVREGGTCVVKCLGRYECSPGRCKSDYVCQDGHLRGEPPVCEQRMCRNNTGIPEGYICMMFHSL